MKTFSFSAMIALIALVTWFLPSVSSEFGVKTAHIKPAVILPSSPKALISNTYYGSGYNAYSDYTFDTRTGNTCDGIHNNATFAFYVAAVPNRFTIYNNTGSGELIYTSDWHGDADYQGPWGSSIHNTNTFSYNYDGSHGRYLRLHVETVTKNTSDPTYQNDYWSVQY